METRSEITTFEANSRLKLSFFNVWVTMFKNIVKSREMILQLFRRDFLAAYKKSFLGFGWVLISPFIGIASWVFLNFAGILQPGDTPIPFSLYVLLGSSIWGLYMGFYSSASGTLGAGSGFIMQVKFPHEAMLAKQIAQHLANFTITFTMNIIVLILFGVVPDWRIIFFPIVVLPLFFLGAGMGLIVSVVSVVATDLTNVFNIFLGFIFYITPIVYTKETLAAKSPILAKIVEINPLTYLIGGVRDLIIIGRIESPERFLVASIFALGVFMLSWRLFFVSEDKVIEKMI